MNVEPDPPVSTGTSSRADDSASEVLQQLSHDIRSAMSDVLGGLRLIDTPRLDPHTQTQIDRVRAAADTLAALVDGVLLTAAGETLIKDQNAEVVFAQWLSALNRRWTGPAAERGCLFSIRCVGALPARLVASPLDLDRIIGNLVANALIHAPGGDVRVDVTANPDGGVSLCVCDAGAGFAEAIMAGSSGDARTGRIRGSGLGLNIARHLSVALEARLHLFNDPDTGGGRARLDMPASRVDWTGEGQRQCDPPDLAGLRILVAEDNLTNQTILRQMLEKMNADAVFVADGLSALDALLRETFDIGLIDIEMPKMSGLEVMEQVRATPGPLSRTPLVAITAYVLRDNREAIYAAGADGIIGKPIASGEAFGRTILRHVGRPSDLPAPEDILSGSGLLEKMDIARFYRLLQAAGEDGRDELLDRLVEDLGSVQRILEQAIATGNAVDIRSQTHILIAISGAVGADRLCQMAEVLNIAAKRRDTAELPPVHAPLQADLSDLIALIDGIRAGLE